MSPDPRLSEPLPDIDLQGFLPIQAKKPIQITSRLTLTENIYFQRPGVGPQQYGSPGAQWLRSTEQEYRRDKLSTTEWTVLERAPWIERASLLWIRNLEKRPGHHNPPAERLQEMTEKTLQLSFGSGGVVDVLIGPGESCRFRPRDLKNIHLRSHLPARYEFVLFPE